MTWVRESLRPTSAAVLMTVADRAFTNTPTAETNGGNAATIRRACRSDNRWYACEAGYYRAEKDQGCGIKMYQVIIIVVAL
jgi:hypothetical protein